MMTGGGDVCAQDAAATEALHELTARYRSVERYADRTILRPAPAGQLRYHQPV
jgi:hypothetical protein